VSVLRQPAPTAHAEIFCPIYTCRSTCQFSPFQSTIRPNWLASHSWSTRIRYFRPPPCGPRARLRPHSGAGGDHLTPASPASASPTRCWWERQRQQGVHRRAAIGEPGRQRGCPLPLPLPLTVAATCARVFEPHPERRMRPYEVLVRPPPLQVREQLRRFLHRRPAPADQRRHHLPQRQIQPLDKGGIELSTQTQSTQG